MPGVERMVIMVCGPPGAGKTWAPDPWRPCVSLSPAGSSALEAVTAERDELQARIDAYEGNVEAWEEMRLLIKASSLGTPEAESLADKAPPGVGRAITLGARYLERAEKAEAMLGAVSAHNAELQEELDVLKQRAIPEAAAIMNELTAERDRLRTVVEQALNLGETEAMARGKEPYPEWWIALDRALDPRERQLDGREDMGGGEHGFSDYFLKQVTHDPGTSR